MNQIRMQKLLNLCMEIMKSRKDYVSFNASNYGYALTISVQEGGLSVTGDAERYYFVGDPALTKQDESTYHACRSHLMQLIRKTEQEVRSV